MTQSDFVHRGQALVSAGQFQEAVKVCRLGLLGRPTTVEGRVVLGQALLALKRYDEVLAEMRVALELDHSAVAAHALKGEALLRKGDRHGAIEALERAKTIAPDDNGIIRLLTEAERVPGQRSMTSAAHPAVGFVHTGTRDYPGRAGSDDDSAEDTSDSEDYMTQQASPQSLASARRAANAPPADAFLEVGDKSGTVEVDPELEGVELDDPPGAVMTPPRSPIAAADFEAPRGKVSRARKDKPTAPQRPPGAYSPPIQVVEKAGPLSNQPRGNVRENSAIVELDSDDMISDDEPAAPLGVALPPRPGARPVGSPSRVRDAVGMPAGPLAGATGPRAPTVIPQPQPPPGSLAQQIAKAPHAIEMRPLAAAMPTQAAMPMPPPPQPQSPAAAMKTLALDPSRDPQMFGTQQPQQFPPMQGWGAQPAPVSNTAINQLAQLAQQPLPGPGMPQPGMAPNAPAPPAPIIPSRPSSPALSIAEGTRDSSRAQRRPRSKIAVVIWIVVGAAVIGGGVFAGFQIRAMRLDSQIADARGRAIEQAKPDTWSGWIAARDSLAGIVQAQGSTENRAALARVRGVLAYELGDGVADAKASIEALKGQGGVDADIAAAYLALALDDVKGAVSHADAAVAAAPDDAEAVYVQGEAQVLGGDYGTGVATLRTAFDKQPRALVGAGLAHALADTGAWDDALAVIDKALTAYPENPALVIARARTLVLAHRIAPTSANSAEIRASLDKVITEGGKPQAEQPRGVSPAQVAFATLAMIRVEHARANVPAMQAALRTLVAVAIDDQRFAEETVDTLASVGEAPSARSAAERALAIWPQSRRATIALAELELEAGQPKQALETLKKVVDATTLPLGLVVRAEARLGAGDNDGARADYDTALKRMPTFERALVGRVALDLQGGDVAAARKLIEKAITATPTPALAVSYASVLRAAGDPASRDKAKSVLEKAVKATPGPDVTRAQLELARMYRDDGNQRGARDLYAEAARAGSVDARVESALMVLDSDPGGGRDSLEQIVKEQGAAVSPPLLVDLARARMLVGEHDGAEQALDAADRLLVAPAPRWQLDRERARLAFRRGDLAGAAAAIDRALDGCGTDADTFLLAADIVATDVAASDPKAPAAAQPGALGALADKLKKQTAARLSGKPEERIIAGILALAAHDDAGAQTAYAAAMTMLGKTGAPRLVSRVYFGLAVVAYDASNMPDAKAKLEYVIQQDPANYQAMLFAIEVADPVQALEYAKQVVRLNPASVYGWYYLGMLGKKAGQDKLHADALVMLGQLAPNSELVKELQAAKR